MRRLTLSMLAVLAVVASIGCSSPSSSPESSTGAFDRSTGSTVKNSDGLKVEIESSRERETPKTDFGSTLKPTPTSAARTKPGPTETPTQGVASEGQSVSRDVGEYSGLRFTVGEGSTITFKVREQLFRLSFPNDATLRTNQLAGDVVLDGGSSAITVDLHSLESDAAARDRYVRRRMFPNDQFAKLVVESVSPLPDGFSAGREVETQVSAVLTIKKVDVPLTFDITAKDQGDRINISGKTTFTWEQIEMPKPTARSVLSVEDEVMVEVELVVRP